MSEVPLYLTALQARGLSAGSSPRDGARAYGSYGMAYCLPLQYGPPHASKVRPTVGPYGLQAPAVWPTACS